MITPKRIGSDAWTTNARASREDSSGKRELTHFSRSFHTRPSTSLTDRAASRSSPGNSVGVFEGEVKWKSVT
jgi:hypothetical protein